MLIGLCSIPKLGVKKKKKKEKKKKRRRRKEVHTIFLLSKTFANLHRTMLTVLHFIPKLGIKIDFFFFLKEGRKSTQYFFVAIASLYRAELVSRKIVPL